VILSGILTPIALQSDVEKQGRIEVIIPLPLLVAALQVSPAVFLAANGTALTKVRFENGQAKFQTNKLLAGSNTITATYNGDCCDYLPASADADRASYRGCNGPQGAPHTDFRRTIA
jgi:hypothetical protein